MNIEQVKDFIRTANRKELNEIVGLTNTARKLLREEIKNQFNIGDTVKVNYKTVNPELRFKITKINRKNIKIQNLNNVFSVYTVSPVLLEKL
tara:strand:+ start:304 stop:579 length:276 start_codon:yes stop_codon:yes gene_type:complete